jgi:hypothetical protein
MKTEMCCGGGGSAHTLRRMRGSRTLVAPIALLLVAAVAEAQLRPVRDSRTERWGYLRADGTVAISPRYVGAGQFRNGRAPVEDSIGFAFIDRMGAVVERIVNDSATATAEQVPPPAGRCSGPFDRDGTRSSLECFVAQLQQGAPIVGGEISRNPVRGESYSSSAVRKIRYGVIVIERRGYEGATVRMLLPRVSAELALQWQRTIRPDLPKHFDGCAESLTSGPIRGGAYLEYSHGC